MKNIFRIILDCDDVLYRCNSFAMEVLRADGVTHNTVYDIHGWGKEGADLENRLALFANPQFVEDQPLMDGAQNFVRELSTRGEIVIATSVPPQCAGVRIQRVLQDFGEWVKPENIIIGHRKDLLVGDVMLDDAPHNLTDACVKYPVLMQAPWNYACGMLSVNGYDEFIRLVDQLKNPVGKVENPELLALIGPSGAGKSTIVERLCYTRSPKFRRVPVYTTNHVTGGSDVYHVMPPAEFIYRKDSGFFLETSLYCGNYYGVRKEDIDEIIASGKCPVLLLDVNGALTLKRFYNSLNVFVPGDKATCIQNILSTTWRSEDSYPEVVRRIMGLDYELNNAVFCDEVTNDPNVILEYFNE